MATALIHIDPKQKARLARRAKKRGRSFSKREQRERKVFNSSRSAVSSTAGCS